MYSVLLVEDEKILRQTIRDTIDWESEGFVFCGEAGDGETALALALEKKPDVLITDIKMPFMDGLELARIVKKELPRTLIVIVSGHDDFAYAQQAIRLGVSEYILKPVTPAKLMKALNNAVEKLQDTQDELRLQVSLEKSRMQKRHMQTSHLQCNPDGWVDEQALPAEICKVDREAITQLLRLGSLAQAKDFAAELARLCFAQANGSRMYSIYFAYDCTSTAYTVAKTMGVAMQQTITFDTIICGVGSAAQLQELLSELFQKIIGARMCMMDRTLQLIHSAKGYIDEQYGDAALTLGSVAEHCGVSANYVSAVFSRETGETFSEYLNKVRIKNAMLLLKSTDAGATQIALDVGYNDNHYFSKMFKKLVGISPREYRKL